MDEVGSGGSLTAGGSGIAKGKGKVLDLILPDEVGNLRGVLDGKQS